MKKRSCSNLYQSLRLYLLNGLILIFLGNLSIQISAQESSGFGSAELLNVGFKGNIYFLEQGTSRLPDFDLLSPVGSIYTLSLNIPTRDFDQGFPGVTDRFEWFAIVYNGAFEVDQEGMYNFRTYSDDGSKLYIDGQLIIDNYGIHPPRSKSKSVNLKSGIHKVRLEYFQGPRTAIALQLFMTSPSGVEKPLEPKENPNISVDDNSTYPTSWQVNCNGYVGLLEYTVDPNTNKVSGKLLNTPAEGYLVDRHLVLHRYPQGKTQIWDGWIMDQSLGAHGEPYYNDQWIIAGTGSQSIGQIDGVYPWYGTASGTGGKQKDPVAGVLDGLRWEMPCVPSTGNTCRAAVQKPSQTATLGGDPNVMYEVTLRFRGVVEYQSYTGGQKDGLWYVGGRSNQGSYNIYKLETTSPSQTFYLNADRASLGRCFPIDYTRTIKVKGSSKVMLSADAQDGVLISNHDGKGNPIIIPGVPPAPTKYDGQFIQMDVIKVKAL